MTTETSATESPRTDILLIENHPAFVTLVREVLRLEADVLSVRAVSSGAEALALELAQPPDLILLDIDLFPDKSGLRYLPLLRSRWPHSRIVILSALDSPEYRELAPKLGADGFLSKWRFDLDAVMLTLQILGIPPAPQRQEAPPSPDGASASPPL